VILVQRGPSITVLDKLHVNRELGLGGPEFSAFVLGIEKHVDASERNFPAELLELYGRVSPQVVA